MRIKSILERCRQAIKDFGEDRGEFKPFTDDGGIEHPNKEWNPRNRTRRVEIMVTGDPSRVTAVADAIDIAQKHILQDMPADEGLETRVTAFLDDCTHRTRWSKKPFKTSARARKLHCEQSKTKFADAFEKSRGEIIDDIILIGHRFDDDFIEAAAQAEQLREQGVHIHCFHTGNDVDSRSAYEELAAATGGVFLQLADQRELDRVMPVLMKHLRDEETLEALASEKRQELLTKLKAQILAVPEDKVTN